jgi:hypothetical protein
MSYEEEDACVSYEEEDMRRRIMRLSLSFVSLFMQEISLSITYPPPHMYPPPHLTLSLYRDFIHAGNLLGP